MLENPSGVRHESLRRGCLMDLSLQLGETDDLWERLLEVWGSGCGRSWRAMLLVTHPSFSSEFSFLPETCWCAHTPAILFVCLFCSEAPWSLGDTQWNGGGFWTDLHRANSEPGSQCPPREQRGEYHCWGTKWNQLIELWHSSRGMVKHHGIWVYKIEGENIQQKIQNLLFHVKFYFQTQNLEPFQKPDALGI